MRRAAITVVALLIAYVAAVVVLDRRNHIFEHFGALAAVLPMLAAFSLAAYALRYARWHWLLVRRGQSVPIARGFLGYIAGFAFTASPGKLGELLRVRYFARAGVPPDLTVSCFLFERMMDLAVLLLLATLLMTSAPGLLLGLAFVAVVFAVVLALAIARRPVAWLVAWFRRRGWRDASRLVQTGSRAFTRTLGFFNVRELAGSLALGIAAWGLQAIGFALLLAQLGIVVPAGAALGIQPAATLIGAASLLPGGIGSTEAATVLLLRQFEAPLNLAILVAIGMRLATLWFATVIGFAAVGVLELRAFRRTRAAPTQSAAARTRTSLRPPPSPA